MSTIKVDTIATRTGSGNITLSNNVASLTSAGAISGTNLSASGTLAVTGNTTVGGTLVNTGLITASAGVAIGGTGSANTLDDYEEGTFTPVAEGNSTAGTMTNQASPTTRYTKIGNMVHLNVIMHFTLSGESGTLRITGLPFACKSGHDSIGTFQCNNMEDSYASNVAHYTPIIQSGETHIHFRGTRTNGGSHHTMAAQDMEYIRVMISYPTD